MPRVEALPAVIEMKPELQALDDLIGAAEAEDAAATFALEMAMDSDHCEASSALSESILEVAHPFFDPEAVVCS